VKNTELKREILLAYIRGGGEHKDLPRRWRELVTDASPHLTSDEIALAVKQVTDSEDLSFVLDHMIWYSLPWEVGDAIFQRLFHMGRRDEKFLGTCMAFHNYMGPEGDARLLEMMERLDEEGHSKLKQHLDPNLILSKKYRSKHS
jgi:hypothetical protein